MIGIYKIENKINGKVYIGQSNNIEKRWSEHISALNNDRHANSYLQRAWKKYGRENFEFSILETMDNTDMLNKREIYWIDYYGSHIRVNGYNLTAGGDGNRQITDDEVNELYNMYNTGDYIIADLVKHFGFFRKTITKYLRHGASLGLCNYDSEEARLKAFVIKVICLTTMEVFDSVDMAEKRYNINGITSCCKKKKSYCGKNEDGEFLLWMYYDEYIEHSEEEIKQYVNTELHRLHSKDVVCLNTKEIFNNTQSACDWCGLKTVRSIQLCCTNQAYYAGKHPETGEKLIWRYYQDYVIMKESEILELVHNAQISIFTKRVICLNNLKVFDSPDLASIWCGATALKIKNCCRNAANNAGNNPMTNELLTWAYYDDYLNMSEDDIENKLFLINFTYSTPDKMRTVICLNNLVEFKSQREAGQWCKLNNPSQIGYAIRNSNGICGVHPYTGEPLLWMYKDDYKLLSNNAIQEKLMAVYKKQIVCVNTGDIYNSYKDAATWCGLRNTDGIRCCCEGKQKTSGLHPITNEPLEWMFRHNYIIQVRDLEESVAS